MRRTIRHPVISVSLVTALAVALAVVPLSGCAGKADAGWKTPADEAELAKLEAATLEKGLPRARRAQLFFLWGQELAEKDPDRAIGAFERVVDLHSILVDESRFNLEILWRQKERQQSQDQQNQQNQKDQKDQKNSQGQSGKDDQNQKDSQDQKGQQGKNGQQNQKDQQSGQNGQNKQDQNGQQSKDGQQSAQSDADNSKPKDLSALVRDKEQSSDLDKALKAELERRNEQQTTQAGGVAPVEKDW
jgi:hypothetical protein